ncbi:MAG: toll/interleukin-1 receptor domain-containing protein [Ktedonobacteraceae bacterium]
MISNDTLFRSQGLIPEVFLERAGVLRIFQEHFPSLVRRPLVYSSCFMSYASEDRAFAERLYTDLQQQQVPCWYASVDIETNDLFQKGINEALLLYDKLLLVLSSHSVASTRVEYEVMNRLD